MVLDLKNAENEVPLVEIMGMLSPEQLNEEYLNNPDSRPVVLHDLTQGWRAMTEWSFEYFEQCFGDERILVTDFIGSDTLKKTTLKAYLAYVKNPEIDLFPGTTGRNPWYAPYWSPLGDFPSLRSAFDVSPAIESWLPNTDDHHSQAMSGPPSTERIMSNWALRGFTWLFIGPAGTKTPRHIDTLNTHAWNTQITGAKRFDLWKPRIDGTHKDGPPDVRTVLSAGDTLIIPAQWSHSVEALAPSISLTGNFFNRTNCAAFFEAIYTSPSEWRSKGRMNPELAARMPA
ncbi:cupin-like domain-containing protein [Tritonibacter mobilis]|uniref:cupin-like domain-containing protein n=1 Tax=Tritonibacter mobilis TaxID=379347 RepID=UPI000E0DA31A|nr:cupin-like domain-containing protein [Tritonibacter mobilis]